MAKLAILNDFVAMNAKGMLYDLFFLLFFSLK